MNAQKTILDELLEVAQEEAEKTGWIIAEVYRGSGRPTGHAWEEAEGEWDSLETSGNYRLYESWDEFNSAFEFGEHDQCHSPSRADWRCQLCQEAGWV